MREWSASSPTDELLATDGEAILKGRAHNLWASLARKAEPIAQVTHVEAAPDFDLGRLGRHPQIPARIAHRSFL